MNARELRTTEPDSTEISNIRRHRIAIILDNVLDTYNVGAIFRLADAVAAERVYLCGATLTPPNSKIKKASVNTWGWVDWNYMPTAVEAIADFRDRYPDGTVLAVEQGKESTAYDEFDYRLPLALVVGNETSGVLPETIAACDAMVELPMWGINTSLNVMVSCGIVLYKAMERNIR